MVEGKIIYWEESAFKRLRGDDLSLLDTLIFKARRLRKEIARRFDLIHRKIHDPRDIASKQKILYIINSKNGERREIPINDISIQVPKGLKKKPDDRYVFAVDGKLPTKRGPNRGSELLSSELFLNDQV